MKVDITQKEVYMIRRKSDGLFSNGGANPIFNKKGKAWSSIGPLKNHLQLVNTPPYQSPMEIVQTYMDCEVIVLKFVIEPLSQGTSPVDPFTYGQGR